MDTRFLYVKVVIFVPWLCIGTGSPAPFCFVVFYSGYAVRYCTATPFRVLAVWFRFLSPPEISTYPTKR